MIDAYIYDGLRTPFGRHGGGLSRIRPDDLLADVMRAVVGRSPFDAKTIDDVMIGCANQAGEDGRCIARHASLVAGLPVEVPGTVLQRNCASGLGAVVSAAHAITCGEGDVVIAGGVESMSRAPFVVAKSESAFSRDFTVFDTTVGARFPNPKISKAFGEDTMPQTADNLAVEYQIAREDCDTFAARSQAGYAAALKGGFFKDEIQSIVIPGGKKGPDVTIAADEGPRADTSLDKLAKLRALNDGGVTTAGNASSINDGAVALMLGSRKAGEKAGAKPRARIVASAAAGVPPRIMGIGPVPASQKALERAGLKLSDMDAIEINEAFAAQVLSCLKGLGVAFDDSRVNPNGGAIALGHPLGASGPRLVLTALRQLERSGGRYALVSLCVGVGQGLAMVMERLDG